MRYYCITYFLTLSICCAGASALAQHARSAEKLCAFRTLDLSHKAAPEKIKEAYRKSILAWHPDKNSSVEATAKAQELNDSYALIGNAAQRSNYRCPSHLTHTLQDSVISFLPTSVSTILQQIAQCFGGTLPLDLIDELQSRIDQTESKSQL